MAPLLVSLIGTLTACLSLDQSGMKAAGSRKPAGSSLSNTSGNGEYYGGKPQPGKYVRRLMSSPCNLSNNELGLIEVRDDGVRVRLTDPQTCARIDRTMEFKELEYSAYQMGRLGFLEGIYTKEPDNSGSGSNRERDLQDEAWCRMEGSNQSTGFDVVIRANYQTREFTAHVVTATVESSGRVVRQTYAPLSIPDRRVELGERLRYRNDDFDIDIETRSFEEWSGTMKATFKYKYNGFEIEGAAMNCRVGGEFDVHDTNRPYDI